MENGYDNVLPNDEKQFESLVKQKHKKIGLEKIEEESRVKELNSLRKIFQKHQNMPLDRVSKVKPNITLLNEDVPVVPSVDPVLTMAQAPIANAEGEPTGLVWVATTPNELKAIYPKEKAISDLEMIIGGAMVQPEVPFALVGPGDARGTGYFVKSSHSGQLLLAKAHKSPKVFTNPGLGPDGDADCDDKNPGGSKIEPFRKILMYEHNDPLNEHNFEVKPIDDSSESVINRLINDSKKDKKFVSLEEVSKLFFTVQSRINEDAKNSTNLENIANGLSSLIAESLLTNKQIPETTIKYLFEKYNK